MGVLGLIMTCSFDAGDGGVPVLLPKLPVLFISSAAPAAPLPHVIPVDTCLDEATAPHHIGKSPLGLT